LVWPALSLKIPGVPIFWAISFPYVGYRDFNFGISGDFYIIDKNLVSSTVSNEDGNYNFKLDWYLGVGFFFNLYLHTHTYQYREWDQSMNGGAGGYRYPWREEKTGSVDFGLRVPVGLSWHIIKPIELFVGLVPGLGFWFGPGWRNWGERYTIVDVPHFYIAAEIGLRFWF
jgi:hypothetical protein